MKILGIETSFDETGAAIVDDGKTILTNVVASSADIHQKYGGVVPEVAARKQIEFMIPVLTEAMQGFTKDNIDAIAVTVGPGLNGSLLVGVETAKTLAFAWNKPIIPVNHVLAHMYAVFLENTEGFYSSSKARSFKDSSLPIKSGSNNKISFPAIALVVSGAHTELYLMKDEQTLKWLGGTLDDAAGECFDKCARLLGLPYPGGPAIASAAISQLTTHPLRQNYNEASSSQLKLPRPMINDKSLNFSFSGLKTAVIREWKKYSQQLTTHPPLRRTGNSQLTTIFAYEIQEAITDVLVTKTLHAASEYNACSIIVTGGVAANQRLSHKFSSTGRSAIGGNLKYSCHIPEPKLCVDSATYIAGCAFYQKNIVPWKEIAARPDLSVEI